ncbi:MAG: YVTN family beta-propeller repeat-containing protein [Dysgonamonadaceae bacterium]|nr:YVTN family beta-propeller repeat-containing protein [Dysgonamonadaceae bacterium]
MRLYNILITIALLSISASTFANEPFFTTGIALSERGEIVLTQRGTNRIDIFSADGNRLLRSFDVPETPTGIAIDGNTAFITTFETKGILLIMNIVTGRVEAEIPVGSGACYPLLSHDKQTLYVCNRFSNTIAEIDIRQRRVVRTVETVREPRSAVLSNDGKYLFVSNFLPAGRADLDVVTACVSVIETTNFTKVKDIQLANGSNALRGICITPDDKYIYVTHNLGRFTVPTSQLQQGWMNTSAFSVIDVEKQEYLGVVLVDEPERGAAGVWGIKCNEDHIYVTHSGTHEVSIINHRAMLEKFLAHPNREVLDYDLRFLVGLRTRVPLEGNGPRELYLTNDKVFIPTYFADVLNVLHIPSGELTAVVLNPDRFETSEHIGKRMFNDANLCFQNWQSCNGCHPGDARMDGLNWDLMNDGIGNPKNCKSLLFSHVTPPSMISGIRESAELAVRMGFRLIQFFDIDEESAAHVDNYLMSLRPVPSPFLVNGELSEKAVQGREVFQQLRCDRCHSGPFYTDMKMHRIGDDIEFEAGWDTPTLIEVWRTAPYLFDGRAATLKDVFTIHKHGLDPDKISAEDMEALVEYVNSL